MEKTIVVNKLVKSFEVVKKTPGTLGVVSDLIHPKKKKVHAVRKISFSVNAGELVGFIGPNGAGKTTTLKVLSGLLYPTSGFVSVLDYNPWDKKEEFLRQISVVFGQKNQLWWDLPAIDTFELNRHIYELSQKEYVNNLEELVTLLDVGKLLKTPVRKLSLGQRMRMELVASLLHKPKILFLDEPTIGLDVVAQQNLRDFIYEYNSKNKATILLTSHNMNDLIDLARRVIVIDEGEIVFDGLLDNLISNYSSEKTIKVTLSQATDIKNFENLGTIKKLQFPEVVLSVPREVAAVAASEILQNFPVVDITITETTIEEIIRKVFRGQKR